MPLRKFTDDDGVELVEIPDRFLKCPSCGAGWDASCGAAAGSIQRKIAASASTTIRMGMKIPRRREMLRKMTTGFIIC